MPSSTSAEAELPLAEAPEKTRWRLVRAIKNTRGMFALFPVESNLYHERRTVFFTELEDDLQRDGITLRRVTLQREAWNLLAVLQELPPFQPNEAVLVLGLEDTPEIAFGTRPGAERPPALNALNVLREAIERHLSCPLILWCPPFAYDALLRHAPDFFDHYSALFAVMEDATEKAASPPVLILDQSPLRTEELPPTKRLSSVESDLAFYQQRLKKLPEPSIERARALIGYSIALGEYSGGDVAEHRRLALEAADEAEQFLRYSNDRIEHARALGNLGIVYADCPSGDRDSNIRRAIECYESALTVYTEDHFPMQWAGMQNNLGNAYANLPTGDRDSNLRRAIECYDATLRVYAGDRFLIESAGTRNNLGLAYSNLSSGDRDGNLRRAIECYEKALYAYSEDRFPMEWAMAQNNLGNAYSNLPTGDLDSNLRRAIECYEATLRVYSASHFPIQWLGVLNNLGSAYSKLSSGDRSANLCRAISYYESALHICSVDHFPIEWAMTQFNIALIWFEQGEISKAFWGVTEAQRVFRECGHQHFASLVQPALEQIKIALQEKNEGS